MKRFSLPLLFILLLAYSGFAQTNISVTDPIAEQIILGNYLPSSFPGLDSVDTHDFVICDLQDALSTDSMLSYLEDLQTFHNRHTFSDTISNSTGIGAARRWAHQKMQGFSDNGSGRLVPAYLQFDYAGTNCGDGFGFRNVLGVLPGADVNDHNVVIVQAHMDSRCEGSCDTSCFAPGMEDNGSGTALVLELARVMSNYVFDHSIVFMLTVGEEQGLLGAEAMAEYCDVNSVSLKAVQNNDVIGGIECGATSSPPSCPFEGHIDSLQVRIFASAAGLQFARNTGRTVKMYYDEKIVDVVDVPMSISIMAQEDRTGRGGDHIPFRSKGFRSIRFTSANEHGNADVSDSTYSDRQHTSGDILGIDTTGNMQIDQYYVDLNYLRRNAMINGSSIALFALGPRTPNFILHDEPTGLRLTIEDDPEFVEYRIAVRSSFTNQDFGEIYRTMDTSFVIPGQITGESRRVSVAAIDQNRIMSPFSIERPAFSDASTPTATQDNLPYGINCATVGIGDYEMESKSFILSCYPNPWNKRTVVRLISKESLGYGHYARIVVRDVHGRTVHNEQIAINRGLNEFELYEIDGSGLFNYSLIVDGVTRASEKMIKLSE